MSKNIVIVSMLIFTQLIAIEQRIVIITAAYNNTNYYQRVLNSVFSQKYDNWHLMYTDDCSIDGSGDLVEKYIEQRGFQEKVTFIKNDERKGALANQYKMIHECNDRDIIIILDGDDWFASDMVLACMNEAYANPDVWLTYGQFQEFPSGSKGFCCSMPKDIVRRNAFRDFSHIPSHLRTFYAGLFKRIKKEDLMSNGDFFKMSGDIAAMMPMIEMARDHFKFIPRILLTYNAETPLNDHKISKKMQREIDLEIRSRRRYDKIKSPFVDVDTVVEDSTIQKVDKSE